MEYSNPKNWYIRLTSTFFDKKEIKLLKNMENGKDYIILLLQLRLLAINTKGKLQFDETLPYNEKMLADLTDTDISIVTKGIEVLKKFNFISILDGNILYMEEVENLIGYTSKEAERKAKYRKRKIEEEQQKEKETEEVEEEVLEEKGQDMGQKKGHCPAIVNSNIVNSNIVNSNIDNSIIENSKEKKKRLEENISIIFEKFWIEYPRKESKKKAKESFTKIFLSIKEEEYNLLFDEMIKKLSIMKKSKQWQDKQFIPHPTTWLNQRRWEDDIEETEVVMSNATDPLTRAFLRRKIG